MWWNHPWCPVGVRQAMLLGHLGLPGAPLVEWLLGLPLPSVRVPPSWPSGWRKQAFVHLILPKPTDSSGLKTFWHQVQKMWGQKGNPGTHHNIVRIPVRNPPSFFLAPESSAVLLPDSRGIRLYLQGSSRAKGVCAIWSRLSYNSLIFMSKL